jgi:hypothetical protein
MTTPTILNPTNEYIQEGIKTLIACSSTGGKSLDYTKIYENAIKSDYIPFYSLYNIFQKSKTSKYFSNVVNCIDRLNKWFEEFASSYDLEVPQDGNKFYTARNAFILLFIINKHTLEYRLPELPIAFKQLLTHDSFITWGKVSLTLDDVVGHIWPAVLSITTTGIMKEGTQIDILGDLRPNIKTLINSTKSQGGDKYKIYKTIISPMLFFNLLSEDFVYLVDVLEGAARSRYRFLITGLGSSVKNVLLDILNRSYITTDEINTLNKVLNQINKAHVYILSNIRSALIENWFSVVRGAFQIVESGGGTLYYTKSDVYLDVSSYTLATVGQFYVAHKLGHREFAVLFSKYLPIDYLDRPREMLENYIKRFIAMSIRIW